jgi:uncharacterized membrane protein
MSTSTISHTQGTGRILGLLLAGMLAWVIGLSLIPTSTSAYAAETGTGSRFAPADHTNIQADDPLGTLGAKMEGLAKNISKIATPIAILCIVLVLVLYLFAPLLPEIAQQNKGYIMRALVIVAIIGLVPEIVKFAAGLTAS